MYIDVLYIIVCTALGPDHWLVHCTPAVALFDVQCTELVTVRNRNLNA